MGVWNHFWNREHKKHHHKAFGWLKRACDLTKSIVWATQTPLSLTLSLSLCLSSFEGVAGRQAGRHNSMKTLSFIVWTLGLAERDWAGSSKGLVAAAWRSSPFIKSMGLMLFFRHFEEPAVSVVATQPLLNSQFMHRMMDDVLAS